MNVKFIKSTNLIVLTYSQKLDIQNRHIFQMALSTLQLTIIFSHAFKICKISLFHFSRLAHEFDNFSLKFSITEISRLAESING